MPAQTVVESPSIARARAAAIPVWVWLTGIVAVSIAVRIALGRRVAGPWIMIDEIVYSELAKSFAESGHFSIRDIPGNGYGVVYPLLIAPAWWVFDAVPSAYVMAKTIGAVVMSLAAVPAYFLARRVLPKGLSLVAAALTVLVPSMLFTGMLMTENAFYPVFILVALALVTTLEQPTVRRQILLLLVCAVAFQTRSQAIALFPAIATAPLLLAVIERRGLRETIRRFAVVYGTLAAGTLAVLAFMAITGRGPTELLGAYAVVTEDGYSVSEVLRFFLYHVAELNIYLGVIAFAALLAMWIAPRELTPAARAFAAASFSLVFWLVAVVAVFASRWADKIEERNMFYVAPLALVPLVGLAAEGVVTRRRRPLLIAAAIAAVLPVFVPFARFIGPAATADTFALLPWWWATDNLIDGSRVRWLALAVGVTAAALFLLVPRRFLFVLPLIVGLYFVLTTVVVENGRHGIRTASIYKRTAGTLAAHPDWIDRAVGPDESIPLLRSIATPDEVVWENEFYNRSVGTIYYLDGVRNLDPLNQVEADKQPDGRVFAGGRPLEAEYVLADGSADVVGRRVAEDPQLGLRLYEVGGPVILPVQLRGLDADKWSIGPVTYHHRRCRGGELAVVFLSDPSLFDTPQTVIAYDGAQAVRRVDVPPVGAVKMTVPLRRKPDGTCTVRFETPRTAVPSQVSPGSTDHRRLGVRFLLFDLRS